MDKPSVTVYARRDRAQRGGATPELRIADQDRDGVDVEIVFPNKGMHSFGTNDPGFAMAMCRAWND